jgi:hypothetical protein
MMPRFLFVLCLAAFFASSAPAQDSASAIVKTHQDDGSIQQYNAFPEAAVKLLFPSGEALLARDASPEGWLGPAARITKIVHFVRVNDTQKRFVLRGVVYGEQLFLFDQLFCDQNPGVMSQLICATGAAPKSPGEALDVAKLYLALNYYDLEDPAQFIAYRARGSAKRTGSRNGKSISDLLGVLHSPQVARAGSGYVVDLYTYRGQKINHRRMTISPAGFEESPDEHAPLWMQAANGFTEDGATTDIRGWFGPDGRGDRESITIILHMRKLRS